MLKQVYEPRGDRVQYCLSSIILIRLPVIINFLFKVVFLQFGPLPPVYFCLII